MTRRPPHLRRSWLFLPGAELALLESAATLGADVLIQELEDFTPPERRPEARAAAPRILAAWRAAGIVATARINPLETGGEDDLPFVMQGRPDAVLMAMVTSPDQIRRLDTLIGAQETALGIAPGSTEIVPNIETARGLGALPAIAAASTRVTAMLVASEDMAADLGLDRTREGAELFAVRQRFHLECTAAGVLPIDCPYTFSDAEGAEADLIWARRAGFKAKSMVNRDQVALTNGLLTPSPAEIDKAGRLVAAFEAARARGEDRAFFEGHRVEVPTYRAARRLLDRAAALAGCGPGVSTP